MTQTNMLTNSSVLRHIKRPKKRFTFSALLLLLTGAVPITTLANETSSTFISQQKNIKVTGKVVDDIGEPLPSATVVLIGSTRGVITDFDGTFTLENIPSNGELEISFLGMESQKIKLNGRTHLNIKLETKADELEEVSVVAFAKQKKESVLASITTVKPSELKVPSSNLTTSLAGRVAGLISYQRSGEPGQDNANFFIRGITSFGADAKKDPLILIDGVELSSDDLARLNPDDIASFSIMKDATATALYGARGANGVIAVTTKEGREGKASVNVRLENSFSSPTRNLKIADPVTYMRMQNEAIKTRDPLGLQLYSPEKIAMTERGLYPDMYPAIDWYDTMFKKTAINRRANLSVSGGGAVARYYFAANISQDNGNIKIDKRNNFNSNINLLKYAVRSNINVNITKTTELIMRMNASFDEYSGPIDGGSELYNKVIQANPVLFKPYYAPDEKFGYAKHILFGNYGSGYSINPYAESLKGYRDYSKNTMLAQFEIKQNFDFITKGLSGRVMFNGNRYSYYAVNRQYRPFFYAIQSFDPMTETYDLERLNPNSGTEYIGYSPDGRDVTTTFYMEAVLEYNKQIREKHNLSGLLVYTMRQHKVGIADNLQLSLANRNVGLSGRFAYNYDSRYFAEFNFGYNGSERFSKNNRWGFFPSIGAAWLMSNEEFFKPLSGVISQFKLKGTYGLVGNDAVGSDKDRFYYLSQVNMNADRWVNFGERLNYNPGGIIIERYPNDKISWETAYKTNIGFELNLVNGFSSIVDYFHEKRTNILQDRVIPSTMGVQQSVKANLGEASGQGIDIEANYETVISKDLWIQGRGTFTYATSKALIWEEPDYSSTPWLSRIDKSLSQYWGLVAERLFVDEYEVKNSPKQFGNYGAGDIKYKDINGDGKISDLDKVPIGHPTTPEINYGFGLTTTFKGFDFSFFFQGSARQSFWIDLGKTTPFMDSNGDDGLWGQNAILKAFSDSYWSEDNRDPYAFWPRLANYYVDNNTQTSTWFMQDASFIRLKSAELGYTFNNNMIKKIRLNNLRIYLSGTNLLTFSRFKLWDPEMAGNGLGYPVQRVINIGLNVGF